MSDHSPEPSRTAVGSTPNANGSPASETHSVLDVAEQYTDIDPTLMQVHVKPRPRTRLNDLMKRDPRLEAWSTFKPWSTIKAWATTGETDHGIGWTFSGPKPVFAELRERVAEEQRNERAKEAEREDDWTAREAETTGSACSTEER